jgi:hypothetical protein
MVVRLSAFHVECLLYPLGIFMVLVSFRGLFNPTAIVRLEG